MISCSGPYPPSVSFATSRPHLCSDRSLQPVLVEAFSPNEIRKNKENVKFQRSSFRKNVAYLIMGCILILSIT